MIRIRPLAAVLAGLTAFGIAQGSTPQDDSPPIERTQTDDEDDEDEPYAIGDEVDEDIVLTDIDGRAWRLGDLRERIVVLDFWSIQCPWSLGYEERFKAFHEEYSGEDLVFLAIDSNHTEVDADAEDPYARIRKYLKKAEVGFPILIDTGNVVADRFDARTTPHVFVIDAEGVLAYRGALDDDPKGERGERAVHYVANAIRQLRAGEEVEVSETKPKGCSIKRVRKEGDGDGDRGKQRKGGGAGGA